MSDLFKDLMGKAKETLDPIVDKAKEAVESGELKDKAGDLLERAAPVIDKLKDVAGDVIDKVKDVANQAMTGEKPGLDVKNDLFAKLGEEVAGNKEAIQEQAAKMEEKIQEILGGDKKE